MAAELQHPARGASGITLGRGSVGYESTEALLVPTQEGVESIDNRGQLDRSNHAADGSGKLKLSQEHYARTAVARDGGAIAQHEPPALAPSFF